MVPEGWKEKPLMQLLERVIDYRGVSVPKADLGIPLITARNIKFGFLDFAEQEFIQEDLYDEWVSRGVPNGGDILFTTEAPLGNACRFPPNGKYAIGQRTVCLRANGMLDSEFLLQYLISPNGQRLIDMKSSGSTAKGIKSSELKKIKVLHPASIYEQKKIAKILATWDQAITIAEQLLVSSQQQKNALMQKLLTGKKRLQDKYGVRFSANWSSVKLKPLLKEEKARNKGNHIERVLSVTNHSGFILPEEQFSKRVASEDVKNYKIVRKGQYGYNPSRLNVGSFARLENYSEGLLSPMYVVFSIREELLNSDYFLCWMSSNEAKQRIAGSTQGSVRDSVGFDALCSFPLNLPALDEQQKIASVLSSADQEITALQENIERLKKEKKALMQQLLTGKRRVKVDELEVA